MADNSTSEVESKDIAVSTEFTVQNFPENDVRGLSVGDDQPTDIKESHEVNLESELEDASHSPVVEPSPTSSSQNDIEEVGAVEMIVENLSTGQIVMPNSFLDAVSQEARHNSNEVKKESSLETERNEKKTPEYVETTLKEDKYNSVETDEEEKCDIDDDIDFLDDLDDSATKWTWEWNTTNLPWGWQPFTPKEVRKLDQLFLSKSLNAWTYTDWGYIYPNSIESTEFEVKGWNGKRKHLHVSIRRIGVPREFAVVRWEWSDDISFESPKSPSKLPKGCRYGFFFSKLSILYDTVY